MRKLTLTLWPKINRVPPLIMVNVHVKFKSDWAKTVVAIVPTRFYIQSAKVDLDLWPRDLKSIGSLLSSWWMYIWSLKVIGPKLKLLSCPQGKVWRTHPHTHPPMNPLTHSLIQPPTNSRVTISPPTLLRGDNNVWIWGIIQICKTFARIWQISFLL